MSKKIDLRLKDYIFLALVLIGLVFFVYHKLTGKDQKRSIDGTKRVIELGEKPLLVKVAIEKESMGKGLSGVESIGENEGMLFMHGFVDKHAYSMNDMQFDLDFIFIREGEVVDIAKSVSRRYNGVIKGAMEYDCVIEVNADWVKRNKIEIGDRAEFDI